MRKAASYYFIILGMCFVFFLQLTLATQGQAIGRDLVSYGYTVTRTIDGFTNQCNADSCVLVYSERVIIPMYGSTGWER